MNQLCHNKRLVMNFVDTHCHIQFKDYKFDPEQTWLDAKAVGVTKILVVGCDLESSTAAVDFARGKNGVYAVVGVHPHKAKDFLSDKNAQNRLKNLLDEANNNKIVAIGEFGLDYFYENSPKTAQIKVLRYHLELINKYKLPAMLHIRDAFADFWPIFDEFRAKSGISGVVHCFSATSEEANRSLDRGLYVALNGIMTFTKDQNQLNAAKIIPLNRLLLETDAPFLTPTPFRGKICKPGHIVHTAEFLAKLRGESLMDLAEATTKNAISLFNLKV